jgi:hypothetical protein
MSLLTDVWENWDADTTLPSTQTNIPNTISSLTPMNTFNNLDNQFDMYGGVGDNINNLTNENIMLKNMLNNSTNSTNNLNFLENDLFIYIFIGYFIIFVLDTIVHMRK